MSPQASLVYLLIEQGAPIEAEDKWKRKPLHLAARGGHVRRAPPPTPHPLPS